MARHPARAEQAAQNSSHRKNSKSPGSSRLGATTKGTASQLFLSPRTIDAHLRNIYAKLGITSRSQLRDADLGETEQ